MWQERADYGHFFYRIPNGESAADAYDRVSGFNESLWRSFGEEDFASVSVLVTHGLMTRVFLMKWYHFSVEYFEDLRNVNHCEFVVMKLNPENGRYVLQNQLRTWSELKRERERESRSRLHLSEPVSPVPIPIPMRKKWGGCHEWSAGDREGEEKWRARQKRQNTADLFMDEQFGERVNEAMRRSKAQNQGLVKWPSDQGTSRGRKESIAEGPEERELTDVKPAAEERDVDENHLSILNGGRDFGGSRSGATSPNRGGDDDVDAGAKEHMGLLPVRSTMSMALKGDLSGSGEDRARADALGDQSDAEEDEEAMGAVEKMQMA